VVDGYRRASIHDDKGATGPESQYQLLQNCISSGAESFEVGKLRLDDSDQTFAPIEIRIREAPHPSTLSSSSQERKVSEDGSIPRQSGELFWAICLKR